MVTDGTRRRVLAAIAAMLAILGVGTYVGMAIEANLNLAKTPVFPLAFLVVPFGGAYAALRRWPRVGRVVVAVFGAGLTAICGIFVAQNGLDGWWADVLIAMVGGTLAVVVLVVALLPAGGSRRSADTVGSGL